MNSSFDLNLLPVQRLDGKDSQAFPGLFMATPPRRPARGRAADLLVIYFNLTGNSPLDEQQEQQLLGRLANLYYKTSGSITAAMKAVAENLNLFLLERNLRSTSSGQQAIGLLTIAVLKSSSLTIAQCGPIHAFLVQTGGTQLLYDSQMAGRGLGLTRSASIRYFQTSLQPNDLLVVTPQPPPGWTTNTLQNVHGQALDSMRRKLLSQAGDNVQALIASLQPGTGKIRLLRPRPPAQMVQPLDAPGSGAPGVSRPEPHTPPEQLDSGLTPVLPPAPIPQAGTTAVEPALRVGAAGPDESPVESGTAQEATSPSLKPLNTNSLAGTEQRTEVELSGRAPEKAGLPVETNEEDELDFLLPIDEAAAGAPLSTGQAETGEPGAEDVLNRSSSSASFPGGAVPIHEEGSLPEQSASRNPGSHEILDGRQKTSPALQGKKSRWAGLKGRQAQQTEGISKRKGLAQKIFAPFKIGSAYIQRAFTALLRKLFAALAALLKHILPDESLFTIPSSTMAFTAIAVGVVIAVAGAMVYFQKGYEVQFNVFYEQAEQAAAEADQEGGPIEVRSAWDTTLFFLDKAEEYKTTEESITLRSQAQRALDSFDYIYRLNYQEAIVGRLGGTVNITQMVATASELFMYNASSGYVMRATATGKGYEIDPDFQCAANPNFGPIVALIPGVKTELIKASVIALDPRGNLMFCNPGEPPKIISPVPPQTNWGSPRAVTIDSGNLYMLDPQANAVWIFRGMDVTNPPHLFFDEQVPPMQNTVALAVNRDDLYMLHSDGTVTTCKFRSFQVSQTRCESPASFSDPRPGRHSGPQILDAQFQQIQFTPPPDPSIYLLDPVNQSVYHFSLRLNLQRQFRSVKTLAGDTATAFAVSPNRTLFLASGNQVYYAVLP